MNETVKKRLLAAAVALAAGAGGIATQQAANAPKPSPAVVLAWEIGAHYESGGRHIGKPYVDKGLSPLARGNLLRRFGGGVAKGPIPARAGQPLVR